MLARLRRRPNSWRSRGPVVMPEPGSDPETGLSVGALRRYAARAGGSSITRFTSLGGGRFCIDTVSSHDRPVRLPTSQGFTDER